MVPCHAGGARFNMIATVSDPSLSTAIACRFLRQQFNKHQEGVPILKSTSLTVFPAIDIAIDMPMIADYALC